MPHISRIVATPLLIAFLASLPACAGHRGSCPASLSGFHNLSGGIQIGEPLPGGTTGYATVVSRPRALAVARIQSVASYGEGANRLRIAPFEHEHDRDLERLGGKLMGADVQPVSHLLAPGTEVMPRDVIAAASRLGADALLVYTYDSNESQEGWFGGLGYLPYLFTFGLAPTVNETQNVTITAVVLDVVSGALVFSANQTDSGWQPANTITDEYAENQVRRRVERRAFASIVDRYIEAMGGPANPPRHEPMSDPW